MPRRASPDGHDEENVVCESGFRLTAKLQEILLNNTKISYHPLTPVTWKDVEGLFGPKGACEGCWCMYWKQKQSGFILNV